MPFIFAVSDFTAPFKGVKLQKIFGLNELRELKNGIRSEIKVFDAVFQQCLWPFLSSPSSPHRQVQTQAY